MKTTELLSVNNSSVSKWIIFFCIALTLLLFGDVIFGFRTLVPSGLLHQIQPWRSEFPELADEPAQQYDQLFQFYPWAVYFRDSIGSGQFPLWNPYTYLGTPFFANPQTAVLFPLTWLHLLFPLYYSFSLILVLKFVLALSGMILWLRHLEISLPASLLGGSIFAVSMDTVVSLAFPYSTVTVLFPWLLLSTARLLDSPTKIRWIAVILAFSLTVLAGQPQSALIAFLGIAMYLACRNFDRNTPWDFKSILFWGLAGLIAAGITAIQWIPAFEYSLESAIALGPRIAHTGLPYPAGVLWTILIPDFFGNPYAGNFWGFPGYQHASFYSSILSILLIPFAFWGCKTRSAPVFAPILGLLGILLMTGAWPFEFLFELPGFDLIKRNKLPFFLIFSMAELSARGGDRLRELWRLKGPKNPRILLFSIAALLPILMLTGLCWFGDFIEQLDPDNLIWHNFYRTTFFLFAGFLVLFFLSFHRNTFYLILLLIIIDLGMLSYPLNPRGRSREPIPVPSSVSIFQETRPRIYSNQNIFQPNTNMTVQLQDVRGYDVMTPERLFRFMQRIDSDLGNYYRQVMRHDSETIHSQTRLRRSLDRSLEKWDSPLKEYMENDIFWSVKVEKIENPDFFRLLQVDYLLTSKKLQLEHYQEIASSPFRILQNSQANRIKVYDDWTSLSADKVLDEMEQIDPDKVLIVEATLPRPNPQENSANSAVIESENTHRVTVQVELERPAVVVLFDRFSPGWKAVLDGSDDLDIFPAHYIFRGVFVPSGKHRIEFRYQPVTFRIGLATSLVCLFLMVLISFRLRR